MAFKSDVNENDPNVKSEDQLLLRKLIRSKRLLSTVEHGISKNFWKENLLSPIYYLNGDLC